MNRQLHPVISLRLPRDTLLLPNDKTRIRYCLNVVTQLNELFLRGVLWRRHVRAPDTRGMHT
jgi:hypothetical protein